MPFLISELFAFIATALFSSAMILFAGLFTGVI